MNITSAKYYKDSLTDKVSGVYVTIDGQVWNVPLDSDNTHYAEVLKQVDAGTLTIEDAD
tara:strand:- start:1548 stop:1724 length:177 start_codon:yes stop_codon:yes gene_type:complete